MKIDKKTGVMTHLKTRVYTKSDGNIISDQSIVIKLNSIRSVLSHTTFNILSIFFYPLLFIVAIIIFIYLRKRRGKNE